MQNRTQFFLVRRSDVDDLQRVSFEAITSTAEMKLVVAINALERMERSNLYHTLAFVPGARVMAGLCVRAFRRYYTLLRSNAKAVAGQRAKECFLLGTSVRFSSGKVVKSNKSVNFPDNVANYIQ
jgi:hypothetical protein